MFIDRLEERKRLRTLMIMNTGSTIQQESITLLRELTFQRLQVLPYTFYNIRIENLDHKILYRQAESSLLQRLYYKLYKQSSKIFFHSSYLYMIPSYELLFLKLKLGSKHPHPQPRPQKSPQTSKQPNPVNTLAILK